MKLTDAKTQVKVDISFNMTNGVNSAKLIKVAICILLSLSLLW